MTCTDNAEFVFKLDSMKWLAEGHFKEGQKVRLSTDYIITFDLFDSLEGSNSLVELGNKRDFLKVLKFEKAIVYLLVDWSGPERVSRYQVYKILKDTKGSIPIFKIDCSDPSKKYVEDWLIGQRRNMKDFYYGGWGETLLISKGQIIDFIQNPGRLGVDETKKKIHNWINMTIETAKVSNLITYMGIDQILRIWKGYCQAKF